jgi:hypothetical protein
VSESTDKDLPNDLPDGPQLEEYLRGGSAVSQQYRQLRSAEVPAQIDQLVLRQAHEAVKSRPQKSQPEQSRNANSRQWLRWSGPLALAASAVLIVSIVIESGVTEKEVMLPVPASVPVEARQSSGLVENTLPADVAATEETTVKAVAPEAARQALPNPVPDEMHANQAQRLSSKQLSQDETQVASEPAPAAAPLPAPQIESARPLQDVQAPTIARSVEVAPVTVRPTAAVPMHSSVRPPTQEAEADFDLSEIVVTGTRQRLGDQEAARTVQGALRGEQNRVAGPRNSIAVPDPPEAAEEDAVETKQRTYSDPEEWLRDIRQLRQQNKPDEADREWRRFRDAFPNYAVAETDTAREVRR